ncbi:MULTISPECIES: hypothetical protein [unclassified Meiothermus]|uniref:hypothetical protein n=1 Tax=unclassified Meiothermus TaxID=370471 RepID=UPI000D7B9E27|nr:MULTISPECIES: hypothetical protein [unclassified Meiothermus]PZA05678.1 hypothetical protein DNA98_17525 [Meiothermus sp. Pnk-1]RYM27935.1 hypothetical protein EWH23_16400 [Meiothermus sp. PNK-Is4]
MVSRIAERLLEDEGLTEGLSDEQAQELLSWLIEIAEDLAQQNDEANPLHDADEIRASMTQLQRLGREMARLSRSFNIPIEELIDLVELAWEDPEAPPAPPAMRA